MLARAHQSLPADYLAAQATQQAPRPHPSSAPQTLDRAHRAEDCLAGVEQALEAQVSLAVERLALPLRASLEVFSAVEELQQARPLRHPLVLEETQQSLVKHRSRLCSAPLRLEHHQRLLRLLPHRSDLVERLVCIFTS